MLKLMLTLTPMQALCVNKALQSLGISGLNPIEHFPIDHADTEFLWKTPQTASVIPSSTIYIPSYMMTTY